jgi:hypothetical protein
VAAPRKRSGHEVEGPLHIQHFLGGLKAFSPY